MAKINSIQLAVHMNDKGRKCLYGSGFCSSDQRVGPITRAFEKIGIHYTTPFACIAVYKSDEDPNDMNLPAAKFGQPVILKPRILSRVEVACARDIQNGSSAENNYNIKHIFRNLQGTSDKKTLLLELLEMRPADTWTEARIFGLLRESDVLEDRYRNSSFADQLLGDF
jgi:hypothetical protein